MYAGFEDLTVLLGYGDDTFTVESTHIGTTTIDAGRGNDVAAGAHGRRPHPAARWRG